MLLFPNSKACDIILISVVSFAKCRPVKFSKFLVLTEILDELLPLFHELLRGLFVCFRHYVSAGAFCSLHRVYTVPTNHECALNGIPLRVLFSPLLQWEHIPTRTIRLIFITVFSFRHNHYIQITLFLLLAIKWSGVTIVKKATDATKDDSH